MKKEMIYLLSFDFLRCFICLSSFFLSFQFISLLFSFYFIFFVWVLLLCRYGWMKNMEETSCECLGQVVTTWLSFIGPFLKKKMNSDCTHTYTHTFTHMYTQTNKIKTKKMKTSIPPPPPLLPLRKWEFSRLFYFFF